MSKTSDQQNLANLIQACGCVIDILKEFGPQNGLADWAKKKIVLFEQEQKYAKNQLRVSYGVDYDATDASTKIIKEGSEVTVLVNHMDGMKSGKAVVKSYSLPAMLSDIIMRDGMAMDDHRWLINNEVKLKS